MIARDIGLEPGLPIKLRRRDRGGGQHARGAAGAHGDETMAPNVNG